MRQIKKSAAVLLCAILAAVFLSAAAGAITLDGIIGVTEWKNAQKTELFPNGTNTNSDINFAYMRVFVDRSSSAVYLAFQVIQKTAGALQPGNTAVGVRLNIPAGTNITCRAGGADEYDRTAYSVQKNIVIGTNNDYVIEMRIGYLFGVPENPLLGLQLIDGYGGFSNYYSFPVAETTASTTAATTKATTAATTAATTTKPATTKAATTAKVTTTKTTTTKATTANSSGSTSAVIQTNGAAVTSDCTPTYTDQNSAGEPATNENGEIAQKGSAGSQNTSGEPGAGGENENLGDNDSGETGTGIGIKKQIAAVAAAAILIGIAVYLCAVAARRKPLQKSGPEKPVANTDETDIDDDF